MEFLCKLDAIPEEDARGYSVNGHAIVAVKKDGQLHTYLNWCPHLGIELNFQPDVFLDSDRQFLVCSNHGALFEIDSGHCISGPCSGDKLIPLKHEIRGDEIWILPDPNDN